MPGPRHLRKEIRAEHVAAVVGAVVCAFVAASPSYFAHSASTVNGAAAADLPLEQEVDAVGRLSLALHLAGDADGQDVLVAVVGAVQVVAVFRIPEVDLHAAGAEQRVVAGRSDAPSNTPPETLTLPNWPQYITPLARPWKTNG